MARILQHRWVVGLALLAVVGTGIGFALARTALTSEQPAGAAIVEGGSEPRAVSLAPPSASALEFLVPSGPGEDGIPSIDSPQFVPVDEADGWIADDELILALIYKGIERAYPLQILVWHEIVNDIVAGDPVLITYCPLCGSGTAYDRTLDGSAVEFGNSGMVYNSNLVMYDRSTHSYWSQLDGLAIAGEWSGRELTPIRLDTVSWKDWKSAHPDSEVLSRNTGFDSAYGQYPYARYHEDSIVCFPVADRDTQIHPKTVVFGVEVNGVSAAYCESDLVAMGVIVDRVGGARIQVSRGTDGIVRASVVGSRVVIATERVFWFAWVAFHPDTKLYLRSGR